ncbi:MAG TPA: hypothetical protein VFE07_04305 [Marmoricola sp.]|nr:hypothetical protein [Marmoricola sp.]
MTGRPAEQGHERRFHPTSGTAIGWLGIGLAVLAVVVVALDDLTLGGVRFGLVAVAFGLLVWCFMLRPRLVIGQSHVELRNAFSSWHVPLAGIRRVSVRAITRITTDEGAYDGIAVGRPMRTLRHLPNTRPARIGIPGLGPSIAESAPADRSSRRRTELDANSVADFAVERILEAADEARGASTRAGSTGTTHRSWAWIEIAALAAVVVALLVTLVL